MTKDRSEAEALLAAAGRFSLTGVGVKWDTCLAGSRGSAGVIADLWFCAPTVLAWCRGGSATGGHESAGPTWADRAKELEPDEQQRRLVDLVCGHVAMVLGHRAATMSTSSVPLRTSDLTRSPPSNSVTGSKPIPGWPCRGP